MRTLSIAGCTCVACFTFAALPSAVAEPAASPHCGADVVIGGELCDPGTFDVVSGHFDLYAKARTVAVMGGDPASGLPARFTAYVFDLSGDPGSGSLAPPVLHVPQRHPETRESLGVMRFDLHNLLPPVWNNTFMINGLIPAGDQPINLHTHGLLVLPHDSHEHGPYGDFVGVLGCPATTKSSCPDDVATMQMTEICGMAKSAAEGHACEGSGHEHHAMSMHGHEVLFGPIPYAINVPGHHPASLNWFHPHAHEISSPQVGAGLSGLLTVGSLCSDPALSDTSRQAICTTLRGEAVLNDAVRERVLMLKDLQVFDRRPGGKPTGGEDVPSAEGYRVIPACNYAEGAPAIVTSGFCAFDAPDSTAPKGHWLFTINGQVQPTMAMETGRPELWRIGNVSSNATYRLSLCRGDLTPDTTPDWTAPPDTPDAEDPRLGLAVCGPTDLKHFQIVSLDGGLKPGSEALNNETEILLPPGARAEILVRPEAGEVLKLVQKGFKEPDLYPPVVLATTKTRAGSGTNPIVSFATAAPAQARPPGASFEKPEDCETKASALGPNDWVSLPSPSDKTETVSVFFGRVSDDPEILTLGLMRGNPELPAGTDVASKIDECLGGKDAQSSACQMFKGSPFTMEHRNLCLKHGTKVTFRLYNLTTETHNFHIHQQKFQVSTATAARPTDPSLAAVVGSEIQRASVTGAGLSPSGAPVVDSIPVPSVWAAPDHPGDPIVVPEVTMSFDRPEQVGDFVFHCHILEHEDKGMMKRITVYTEDHH